MGHEMRFLRVNLTSQHTSPIRDMGPTIQTIPHQLTSPRISRCLYLPLPIPYILFDLHTETPNREVREHLELKLTPSIHGTFPRVADNPLGRGYSMGVCYGVCPAVIAPELVAVA